MKRLSFLLIITAIFMIGVPLANATQAEDTTITIMAQNPGATPFITQLALMASETSVIESIQFTISPKTGSVTRPLSATYSNASLTDRGYLNSVTGEIFLPVYGLYADFTNTVTLTYCFTDGSSRQDGLMITTTVFADPCGYENPTVLQARLEGDLSYDFILVKGRCSTFSPAIIDTDSALRWVGPAGIANFDSTFLDNAVFMANGRPVYRIDLDGTVTLIHDYSDTDITGFHHNLDHGKVGLLLEADTADQIESTVIEIDTFGNILKRWDMAAIISEAMAAGGDDPDQFVYPAPTDWFHNNAVTYDRANDFLIVSSRENFVIAIDYETGTIQWIFGDPAKNWHQFPSLAQFALQTPEETLPPIGQHAVSIAHDQALLLFDNGYNSVFQDPPGLLRDYASPRKYSLDRDLQTATEIWNDEMDQTITSPICGSVYEDAPFNYLIDYSLVGGFSSESPMAELVGLDRAGDEIFSYQYPTNSCNTAFSSIPLHLENTKFPTVRRKSLNLSTRGLAGDDTHALIGGFIVTGSAAKTIILRALGPSLSQTGLPNVLQDPILTLVDASGTTIATNDDWGASTNGTEIEAAGLAPSDPAESAILANLAPGAYTAIVHTKAPLSGLALVEMFDLSPSSGSALANISARGSVGTDANVLISGFILGDVDNATVLVRGLGPSLSSAGITDPLNDPQLTVYDANGLVLASNDDWQDDANVRAIEQNGLAPGNSLEAATILSLAPGAYSTILSGTNGGTGTGLTEVYNLENP